MPNLTKAGLALAALVGLAACGGSGGGGGADFDPAAELAGLRDLDPTSTPQSRLPEGTATYRGVANFNLSEPDTTAVEGYYGAISVTVNFDRATLSGSVDNFSDYRQNPASGRLTITNGRLSGDNAAGLGDGLSAVATGRVAGDDLVMDVTGNVIGRNGEGLSLNFDDRATLKGGVALAAR